jgi:hypothetical protein
MAIVMGPTPPGTGVIWDAFLLACSKCTSPTSLQAQGRGYCHRGAQVQGAAGCCVAALPGPGRGRRAGCKPARRPREGLFRGAAGASPNCPLLLLAWWQAPAAPHL